MFLRFIVDKDGSIANVEVFKSSGDVYLDREAVRVAKSMPEYHPGILRFPQQIQTPHLLQLFPPPQYSLHSSASPFQYPRRLCISL